MVYLLKMVDLSMAMWVITRWEYQEISWSSMIRSGLDLRINGWSTEITCAFPPYIYTYYNIHKVIYYTYIYIHTYCIYNITLYIYIESMNEANEAWLPFLCYSRGSVQWFTTRVRWPAGLGLLVPSQERRCLRLSTGRPCLFLEALFGRSKTMLEYVPTHTLW